MTTTVILARHGAAEYESPLWTPEGGSLTAAGRLGVAVTTRQDLREFDMGELAGTSRDEDPFAPTYDAWLGGTLDARIPGAESGREIVARIGAVLSGIADSRAGGTTLAISHGGVLRLSIPALA